ncbi:MAG: hypothetical protein AAB652_02610 [Patescibacteria group bacterium]
MPDQFSPEFKHETLEADLHRLANEVKEYRKESGNENVTDRELLKQSIQRLYPTLPQKQNSPPDDAQSPLPEYAANASSETKLEIEYLLDMAFHQGIEKANASAKGSNPFVLDAFHDALAGKLYPELERRGLLK